MTVSRYAVRLSWLVALLATIATVAGIFWQGQGTPFEFESVRGEIVEVYGQGIYRFDSVFIAAGNKGTDAVTLIIGVPLILVSGLRYQAGARSGGLLFLGALAYFLYVYSSYALGTTALNALFFLYVILFSASLFAFVLVYTSLSYSANRMLADSEGKLPRRGPAIFLALSGVVTFVVWALPVLLAQLQGTVPRGLDHYTTLFTYALDLAVITPATFIAGFLILRGVTTGYFAAVSLLVIEVMLLPLLIAQTLFQLDAGITFSPGEVFGPIAGFAVLSLFAAWFLIRLLASVTPGRRKST